MVLPGTAWNKKRGPNALYTGHLKTTWFFLGQHGPIIAWTPSPMNSGRFTIKPGLVHPSDFQLFLYRRSACTSREVGNLPSRGGQTDRL